ncbi:MAG: peptidyl-prolyl cis-trans isomerase [Candidatus Hydrogenedentes bacterium]|nr:peptidyl-prolyl cis-trans isomerase [Candidatus Hydrogenedentota bacterium]
MPLTFEKEIEEEPKDRTKLIWLGVIVVFIGMLVVIWSYGRLKPHHSVVRAKHILISSSVANPAEQARALELAQDLRKRILAGEDFGKLAEKYSNDPQSASRGGDLGYVDKGTLTPGFEEYVWSAPVGQLSEVIKTSFGYHLIVVVDRIVSDIDRAKQRENEEWHRKISGERQETDQPAPSTAGTSAPGEQSPTQPAPAPGQ